MEAGRGAVRGSLGPSLQHSLFIAQRGDSPQVFSDFYEFRGVLLFLLRGVFQLKGERSKSGQCVSYKGIFLVSEAGGFGESPASVLPQHGRWVGNTV